MRSTFVFHSDKNIVLPVNYQTYLQGFIYSNIGDEELRNNLHNNGIRYNKSPIKHFTFSRLMGRSNYNEKEKTLDFGKQVSFVFSTKLEDVEREIIQSCFLKDEFKLANNHVKLSELRVQDFPFDVSQDEVTWNITMLSPLTLFQTTLKGDGTKYRVFFHPNQEKANSLMISKRLEQKYRSYYKNTDGLNFNVTLKQVGLPKKTVVRVKKNEVYEAYAGEFTLTGQEEVLKFAYDVGIGKKNSLGFGMFEKK
jgi:CRISPR-associated endoribonuclease Cas6